MKLLGLESAEIFPAVISEDCRIADGKVGYGGFAFVLHDGHVANFYSNLMLWQLSVQTQSMIVILEDDALLPSAHAPGVVAALREFESLPDAGEILYLLSQEPTSLATHLKSYPPARLSPLGPLLLRLANNHDDLAGTAAYAVKPVAARRLIEFAGERGIYPTDGFIGRAMNSGKISVLLCCDYTECFFLHDHLPEPHD
jgi:GR25 family glycosyltransferase involved in LPS biosynthesis